MKKAILYSAMAFMAFSNATPICAGFVGDNDDPALQAALMASIMQAQEEQAANMRRQQQEAQARRQQQAEDDDAELQAAMDASLAEEYAAEVNAARAFQVGDDDAEMRRILEESEHLAIFHNIRSNNTGGN